MRDGEYRRLYVGVVGNRFVVTAEGTAGKASIFRQAVEALTKA